MAAVSWAMQIAGWTLMYMSCPWIEGLETAQDARVEDDARVSRLRQRRYKTLGEQGACEALALRLADPRGIPDTLASKRYMRIVRAHLTLMLQALLKAMPGDPVAFVTLMPAGHGFTLAKLATVDPTLLRRQLRMCLQRCGANPGVAGWAFAYLDGEYNPQTDMVLLHWHVLATGDMIAVFERLKARLAYTSVRRAKDSPDGVATRVHIKPVTAPLDPQNPQLITYCMKGSFYARRRGEKEKNGEAKRCSQQYRSRIPEPQHSQVLLWLDRWRFQDMMMLVNLRLGKEGLYRVQLPNPVIE